MMLYSPFILSLLSLIIVANGNDAQKWWHRFSPDQLLDKIPRRSRKLKDQLTAYLYAEDSEDEKIERLSELKAFAQRHRIWFRKEDVRSILIDAVDKGGRFSEFRALYSGDPELKEMKFWNKSMGNAVISKFSRMCRMRTCREEHVKEVNEIVNELFSSKHFSFFDAALYLSEAEASLLEIQSFEFADHVKAVTKHLLEQMAVNDYSL